MTNTLIGAAPQNNMVLKMNTTGSSEVRNLAGDSTYRGLFGNWFNGRNIAAEDYLRSEQSALNAFNRESSFNASEAEKQRSFEERMTRNAYTYAIEDLKRNGINPVLAYGGSPAATPAGSSARSSGGSSSYRRSSVSDEGGAFLVGLAKVLAGVYTKNAELTASGASQLLGTSTTTTRGYDSHGHQTETTTTSMKYGR